MSHRPLLLTALPTVLLALGCSASAGTTGQPPTGPGDTPPITQASVSRDDPASIGPAALGAAVTANNAFAFDLFAHVRAAQTSPGNLWTSPVSASLALTMTYAGAKGQTATEMAGALHLDPSVGNVFDGQNALSGALESRAAAALAAGQQSAKDFDQPAPPASDFALDVVNSVWGQKGYAWADPFLTTLAKSYGTGVYGEDFAALPEAGRAAINLWVSDETAGKIADLLPPGSIDASTAMVLVNAVHLKLPWETPFDARATTPAPFTKGDGSQVTVPFMAQIATLPYVDDGNAQIVAVPLMGHDVSVVFAVPHGDLATYEAGLTSLPVPASAPADVSLFVPKLTYTSASVSLSAPLQAMGMKRAFVPGQAELQGMCPSPQGDGLFVSDVIQKATVTLQEAGVEAAAATAVTLAGGAPEHPPQVRMDRPFVMAIVDRTGAVLFLGHFVDPTASGG
jgi:serpin B